MGAEARLLQISEEAAAIHRAFPELRRGGGRGIGRGRGRGQSASSDGADTAAAGQPRRRRRLSAAARKRISDAQKKRWAKHRQEK
jgi:hypothetical protein